MWTLVRSLHTGMSSHQQNRQTEQGWSSCSVPFQPGHILYVTAIPHCGAVHMSHWWHKYDTDDWHCHLCDIIYTHICIWHSYICIKQILHMTKHTASIIHMIIIARIYIIVTWHIYYCHMTSDVGLLRGLRRCETIALWQRQGCNCRNVHNMFRCISNSTLPVFSRVFLNRI